MYLEFVWFEWIEGWMDGSFLLYSTLLYSTLLYSLAGSRKLRDGLGDPRIIGACFDLCGMRKKRSELRRPLRETHWLVFVSFGTLLLALDG